MLRLVFWVCLLVMFIPIKQDGSDLSSQQVSTQETFAAANSIYGDISQFCERNPQTCDTGRYYASQFKEKTRAGANMLLSYLEEGSQAGEVDAVTTSSISK